MEAGPSAKFNDVELEELDGLEWSTKKATRCDRRYLLAALLAVLLLLIACIVVVFVWHSQRNGSSGGAEKIISAFREDLSSKSSPHDDDVGPGGALKAGSGARVKHRHSSVEPLLSASNLLTLLITKRKVCLFEVSTSETESSRLDFQNGHIQTARLLFFGNLSHSGVPVHPLQFQRYVRNLGVDADCHVVVYDRGQQIWATYAYWIFHVYGHEKVSLLNGGFPEWKRLADEGLGPYGLDYGHGTYSDKLGNFRAEWKHEYISTFDDIVANFDNRDSDIVDAQSPEEYDGRAYGAVFGHIRTAVNIPVESLYDFDNNTWLSPNEHREIFQEKGLAPTRPVILYDGTSLRSSVVWFALRRLQYATSIYFGSWPEFLIRAPDYLKVIQED
ncbi:Rhodanese-like domain containing protein [Aphelenchoides avenae]|nr:Rhodanese-like domain containing protein [Aphelenchus avenae]